MRTAFRWFIRWMIARPTMAAIIVLSITHRGLHYDWVSAICLAWLTYCFVSDGDKARSNITVNVQPNRATDFLYQAAKARNGGGVQL